MLDVPRPQFVVVPVGFDYAVKAIWEDGSSVMLVGLYCSQEHAEDWVRKRAHQIPASAFQHVAVRPMLPCLKMTDPKTPASDKDHSKRPNDDAEDDGDIATPKTEPPTEDDRPLE